MQIDLKLHKSVLPQSMRVIASAAQPAEFQSNKIQRDVASLATAQSMLIIPHCSVPTLCATPQTHKQKLSQEFRISISSWRVVNSSKRQNHRVAVLKPQIFGECGETILGCCRHHDMDGLR